MRLGDLDALKEDLKHRLEIAKTWKEDALNNGHDEIAIRAEATIDFICEVIMTIDNAPTVEASKVLAKEAREIADENYKYGYEKGKNERPQGEWKPTNVSFGTCFLQGYECKCGRVVMQKEHFCPECGADMRGGAE